MKKRGFIIAIIMIISLSTIISAQNFDVSISMPSSVDAGEEFDVVIDLNVINPVSNGVFLAATVPSELQILSATPDNNLVIGNVIMWTLDPIDTNLSFRAKSINTGVYNISVKVGTYYKITDIYEETGSDGILTVAEEVYVIDANGNGIIETSELLEAINRWIANQISTSILLEAINLWIG